MFTDKETFTGIPPYIYSELRFIILASWENQIQIV